MSDAKQILNERLARGEVSLEEYKKISQYINDNLSNDGHYTKNLPDKFNHKNFFTRLTEGRIPLARTYWIYGCLVNVALSILVSLFYYSVETSVVVFSSIDYFHTVSYSIITITVIYSAFISVAIWRSANRFKGKKIWAVLAKLAVGIGILSTVGQFSRFVSDDTEFEATIVKEVQTINKNSPIMIDNLTRLDSARYSSNIVTYFYTIIGYDADSVNLEDFYQHMFSTLQESSCQGQTLINLQNLDQVRYYYRDRHGKLLADVILTSKDCLRS